jgi:ribonuclease P protein component
MVAIDFCKPVRFTFRKNERLKKNREIESLFLQNRSINMYPFKLVWMINQTDESFHLKAGFSVSKRNFKRAIDRNYIKRRMRECFRLNKNELYQKFSSKNIGLTFMLIYSGKEAIESSEYEPKIKQLLTRLIEKISQLELYN